MYKIILKRILTLLNFKLRLFFKYPENINNEYF